MYEIYLITNQINEKRYVGQTVKGLRIRFIRHRKDARKSSVVSPLHKAMKKYGPERFTISLLATAMDQEDLNKLEKFWIKTLKTKSPLGYNITDGGGECSGFSPNEETRKKKSNSLKGRFLGRNTGDKSPVFRDDLDNRSIIELYEQGKSSPQIAKLLGTNSRTIQNRLKFAGITSRSVSEANKLRNSDPEYISYHRKDVLTEDIVSMFEEGFSPQEIARRFGFSGPGVIYRLQKEGISRTTHRTKVDIEQAIKLYLSCGSPQQVATQLGTSKSTIIRILKKNNVPKFKKGV